MNKIPVGRTIEFAYEFTFANLGAIIGLIWLPTVLSAVGSFFVQAYYSQTVMAAIAEGRPAAQGQALLSLLAWSIVAMLLGAIMYVVVLRQALGLRKGPAFFHFALGPAEFRMFGAQLGLAAIMAGFAFVYVLAVAGLAVLAKQGGGAALPAVIAMAIIAFGGALFLIFVFVRLSFLLFPATLVEEKVGLSRSWALSKGNFWRIVVIGLATLGPALLAVGVAEFLILGPDYFLAGLKPGATEPANQAQAVVNQSRIMMQHLPLLLGLQLATAPFVVGLTIAPAAAAWRALTSPQPPAQP